MNRLDFDCICGIDPGSNGGIAVWRPNQQLQTIKMPKDLSELRGYLKSFRIQQLLMAFQRLKDYIEVGGIPYVLFHPMSWQNTLKLRTQRKETKRERKNRYKSGAVCVVKSSA